MYLFDSLGVVPPRPPCGPEASFGHEAGNGECEWLTVMEGRNSRMRKALLGRVTPAFFTLWPNDLRSNEWRYRGGRIGKIFLLGWWEVM